jgi:hypothetical protein
VSGLEIINLLVVFEAVGSALTHKCISLSQPVEPLDAGLNEFVQSSQMIIEKILLLLIYDLHDTIVITYNQHNVFTQDTKLLFSSEETGKWQRESDQTESLNLVPVLNFKE